MSSLPHLMCHSQDILKQCFETLLILVNLRLGSQAHAHCPPQEKQGSSYSLTDYSQFPKTINLDTLLKGICCPPAAKRSTRDMYAVLANNRETPSIFLDIK